MFKKISFIKIKFKEIPVKNVSKNCVLIEQKYSVEVDSL